MLYILTEIWRVTYILPAYTTLKAEDCNIYGKPVPFSMAWETSVGQSYLLQQTLAVLTTVGYPSC